MLSGRMAAGAEAGFSTARWPVFLDEVTLTAAGFSMATMARAVGRSFSQVLFRFMMWMPSLFLLYCAVWKSSLVPPQWVPAARNERTSSSFICRTSRAPDIERASL